MNAPHTKKFISTKDASDLSGYNPDHLSRLARSGEVDAVRVGRTWHIERESLEAFLKKQGRRVKEFEGLISAKDASKKYGYSADYLARLARSGEVKGSQIGRTWLVEKESLEVFLKAQEERKTVRARALARARELEYRARQAPAHRVPAIEPRPMPVVSQQAIASGKVENPVVPAESPYVFSRMASVRAFAAALLVVVFGAVVAHAGPVAELAAGTASAMREVAAGFDAAFGNIPARLAARVSAPLAAPASVHPALNVPSLAIVPSEIPNESWSLPETLPPTGLKVEPLVLSPAPSSLVIAGKETLQGWKSATAGTLAFLSSPVRVAQTVADISHAAIHADIALTYGLAAAAPASARTAVALIGGAGDLLAGTTARVPALAASLFLETAAAPARIAPALAQAIFSNEYAAASRLVAFMNNAGEVYLAFVYGGGDAVRSSALAVQSAGSTGLALAGSLLPHIEPGIQPARIFADLANAPAALQDAYLGALGKSALALAAVQPALSAGEQVALTTYETIHGFISSTADELAFLFGSSSAVVPPTVAVARPTVAVATSTPQQTARVALGTTTITRINAPSYPTYVTNLNGVSVNDVKQLLAAQRSDILATVAGQLQPIIIQGATNQTTIQQVNMIQKLDGLIVDNGVFHGGTFDGGTFAGSGVSAMNGSFTVLNAASSTVTGAFAVGGNSLFNGDLTASGTTTLASLTASGLATFRNGFLSLASSTVTSGLFTMSGGASTTNLTASGIGYFGSSIAIGTSTPDASLALQQTINGVPFISAYRATDIAPSGDFINFRTNSGTTLFRVDNSGNLLAGGIVNTGSQTITSTSTPQLRVQYDPSNEITFSTGSTGTTTIGLSGTAPGLVFAPQANLVNTFNFTTAGMSNSVLSIDTLNRRVGIGTTSPWGQLSVNPNGVTGPAFVIGSSTATNLIVTNAGNIGIGTNVPSEKLQIAGGNIRFDGGYGLVGAQGSQFVFQNGGNTYLRTAGSPPAATYINDNQATNIIMATGGGNVGIGTTSPSARLTITGSGLGTGNALVVADSNNTTNFAVTDNGTIQMSIGSIAAGSGAITIDPGSQNGVRIASHLTPTLNNSYDLGDGIANGGVSEWWRTLYLGTSMAIAGVATSTGTSLTSNAAYAIDSKGTLSINTTNNQNVIFGSGNVGIGTTSPGYKLDIYDPSIGGGVGIRIANGDGYGGSITADNAFMYFNGSAGTTAFEVADGKIRMGTGAGGTAGRIELGSGAISYNGNSNTAGLYLDASDNATLSANLTVKGVGNSSFAGNVGIGTTSPYSMLSVAGQVVAQNFVATTTTATSTLAGTLSVGTLIPPSVMANAQVQIFDNTAGSIGLVVKRGANNLSGVLQEWQDHDGVMQARISNNGTLTTPSIIGNGPTPTGGNTGNLYLSQGAANGLLTAQFGRMQFLTDTNNTAVFSAGTSLPTVLQGYNSSGSTYTNVQLQPNGGNVGVGTTSPWAQLSVNPNGITGPAFVVGSSTATNFIVTNGGNVGIGIANPAQSLAVVSKTNNNADGILLYPANLSQTMAIGWAGIAASYSLDLSTAAASSQPITLSAGGSERMRIAGNTGYVGIGTTSPYSMLSVAGQVVGQNFVATSTTATSTFAGSFNAGGAAGLTVYQLGGNMVGVGIGTANPTADLHIKSMNISSSDARLALQPSSDSNSSDISFLNAANTVERGSIKYSNLNNSLDFGTNSVNGRLHIDSSGNVGIGTTTFNANLVVNGTTGQNLFQVATGTNQNILVVNQNGNVGIGMTPTMRLEVTDTAGIKIGRYELSGPNGAGEIIANGNDMRLRSTNNVYVDSGATSNILLGTTNGKVGIGTTTPTSLLTVGGNGYFAGSLTATNITATGTMTFGTTTLTNLAVTNTSTSTFAGAVTLSQKLAFQLAGYADDKGISFLQTNGSLNRAGYIDYTGNANFTGNLVFGVNATVSDSPAVEIMRVVPNGVTIGANSGHLTTLTVNDTVTTGEATLLALRNTGNVGDAGKIVFQTSAAGATGGEIVSTRTAVSFASDLFFRTAAAGGGLNEWLRITSAGNVGIGTSSPLSKLAVSGGASIGADYNTAAPTNGLIVEGNVGIGVQPSAWATYKALQIGSYSSLSDGFTATVLGYNTYYNGANDIRLNANFASRYFQQNGANIWDYAANGTAGSTISWNEAMRIDASGNVGIGTTSPSQLLSVQGNGLFSGNISAANITATGTVTGNFSVMNGYYVSDTSAGMNFAGFSPNTGNLAFRTGGVDGRMVINSSGNIGIGTTSPLTKLSIQGTAGANNDVLNIASSTGASMLYVNASGNIGIGNAAPTFALEVGSASAGQNAQIDATLGSNIAPTLVPGNWTATGGWSVSGGSIIDAGGSAGTITPTASLGIVAGTTYKVVMTVSSYTGPSTYISYSLGGTSGSILSPARTVTDFITAQTSASLVFTDVSTGETVTITSLTIQPLAANTGNLTVQGNLSVKSLTSFMNPVGFNMATPVVPVEINTTAGGDALRIDRTGTPGQYIAINEGGGAAHQIQAVGDKPLNISNGSTSFGINFFVNNAGTQALTILPSGNIGIGNASPAYNLDVTGLGRFTGLVDAANFNATSTSATSTFAGGFVAGANAAFTINRAAPATSFYMTPGGAIGIGTSSPSVKFSIGTGAGDTNGHVYLTGGLGVGVVNTTSGSVNTSGNIMVGLNTGSSATVLISKLPNCNTGSQVLQTDGSGGIICGTVTAIGGTSAGGWTWVAPNKVQLATSTDVVGIGTVPASNAKLTIDSGSGVATTTLALWAASAQTADILDVYDNTRSLNSVITSAGRFGIGAAAPGSRLQVGDGTVNTQNQILLGKYESSSESGFPVIQQKSVLSSGNGNDLALGAQSTTGGILFYTGATSPANQLGTSANAIRMAITSSGNVGIGTTSPSQALSVQGNGLFSGNVSVANLIATGTATFGTTTLTNLSVTNTSTSTFAGPIASASGNFIIGVTGTTNNLLLNPYATGSSIVSFGSIAGNNVKIDTNGTITHTYVPGGADHRYILSSNGNADLGLPSAYTAGALEFQTGTSGNFSLISGGGGSVHGGSGTLNFFTGSNNTTSRVTIDESGNVGIGTTSPQYGLDVEKGTSVSACLNRGVTCQAYFGNGILTGAGAAGAIQIGDSVISKASGSNWIISAFQPDTDAGRVMGVASARYADVWTLGIDSGASPLVINANSTGSVGIGTTSPAATLGVNGNGYFAGSLTATNITATGTMSFGTTTLTNLAVTNLSTSTFAGGLTVGTSQFVVQQATGNVGIGTTNPGHNLAVYSANGTDMYLGHDNTSGTFPKVSALGLGSNAVSFGYANNGGTLTVTGSAQIAAIQSQSGGAETALAFYTTTGGSVGERMRILNSGNVGIGTTTPGQKLVLDNGGVNVFEQIGGGAASQGAFLILNGGVTAGASEGIEIDTAGVQKALFRVANSGQADLFAGSSMKLSLGAGGTSDKLVIDTAGNVGIATTSPSMTLSVTGNQYLTGNLTIGGTITSTVNPLNVVTTNFRINNNLNFNSSGVNTLSGDLILSSDTSNISFRSGTGVEHMRLGINGNLGIGTTSPSALFALDVQGNGLFSGNISAANITATGTLTVAGATSFSGTATTTFGGPIGSASGNFIIGSAGTANNILLNPYGGNVGIGTSSPTSSLTIEGGGTSIPTITISGTSNAYTPTIRFIHNAFAQTAAGTIIYDHAHNLFSMSSGYASDALSFQTYSSGTTPISRMLITNSGLVGIGTTSPLAQLDVAGANNATAPLFQLSSVASFATTTQFIVTNSGNVGIGTSNTSAGRLVITQPGSTDTQNGGLTINNSTTANDLHLWMSSGVGAGHLDVRDDLSSTLQINAGGTGGLTVGYANTAPSSGAIIQGSVGIGTTSPQAKLSVNDGGSNVVNLQLVKTIGGSNNLTIGNTFVGGSTFAFNAGITAVNNGGFEIRDVGAGASRIVIDPSGNVGIGTTTPASKLAVSGGASVGADYNTAAPTNGLIVEGNIGIGTTNPGVKLDVAGSIRTNIVSTLDLMGNEGSAGVFNNNILVRNASVGGTPVQFALSFNGGVVDMSNARNAVLSLQANSTGNVGIGTTTPASKLAVSGGASIGADYNTAAPTNGLIVEGDVGIGSSNPSFISGVSLTGKDFHVQQTNGTQNFFASAGTNGASLVGVGTSSPMTTLAISSPSGITGATIAGSTAAYLNFYDTNDKNLWQISQLIAATSALNFVDNGTTRLTLQGGGNVGIGTTTPWGQLSVNPNGVTGPAFVVGSSTATNFIVTNGGNVGVGTASPSANLHIYNPSTSGSLRIQGNGGGNAQIELVSSGQTNPFYVYENASRDLIFQDNASERMRIASTGNVGIGTTTPQAKLEIASDASLNNQFIGLSNTESGNIRRWMLGMITASSGKFRIYDATAGQDRVVIDSNGNVGIGTTNPGTALDVRGDVTMGRTGGSSWDFQSPASDMRIVGATSGANFAIIPNGGNVGIGTTSPRATLDVNGPIVANGQITTSAGKGIILDYSPSSGSGRIITQDTSPIAIYTNGTERMRIDGTGNVGIGTTTPAGKLEVAGGNIVVSQNFGLAVNRSGVINQILSQNSSDVVTLANPNSNIIVFSTAGAEKMRLQNNGNFGIGTTSPYMKLAVSESLTPYTAVLDNSNAAGSWLRFTKTSGTSRSWDLGATAASASAGDNKFALYDNGASAYRMVVDSAGNIGIGTTSPVAKLAIVDANAWSGNYGSEVISDSGGTGPGLTLNGTGTGGRNYSILSTQGSATSGVGKLAFIDGTAGLYRMVIDSAGNVGIGSTTPNDKLTVSGDVSVFYGGAYKLYNSAGTGWGQLKLSADGLEHIEFNRNIVGSSALIVYGGASANADLTLDSTSNATKGNVIIQPTSGNVGIGTAGPTAPLMVSGSGGTFNSTIYGTSATADIALALYSANNAGTPSLRLLNGLNSARIWLTGDGSGDLNFGGPWNSTTANVTFKQSGNVGIGTTSPAYKLDVYGASRFADIMRFGSVQGFITWGGSMANAFDIAGDSGKALSFGSNGVYDRMVMDTSGNVGIGTTSPVSPLNVYATSGATGNVATFDSAYSNGGFTAYRDLSGAATTRGFVGFGPTVFSAPFDNTAFGVRSQGTLVFTSNASAVNKYMVMDTSGNVGIGTTTPGNKLVIAGGSLELENNNFIKWDNTSGTPGVILGVSNDNSTRLLSTSGNDIRLHPENNTSLGMILKATTGNVGIGTTSPTDVLHVVKAGDAKVVVESTAASYAGFRLKNPTRSWISQVESGTGLWRLVDETGGTVPLTIEAAAPSNALYIKATTGNVGIGTTSPSSKLAVSGGASIGADYNIAAPTNGLIVEGNVGIGTVSPGANGERVTIKQGANYGIVFQPTTQDTVGSYVTLGSFLGSSSGETVLKNEITNFVNGSNYGTALTLWTRNTTSATERVRIDSSGNVGIGTTSPNNILSVEKTQNAATEIDLNNFGTGVNSASRVRFGEDQGTKNGVLAYGNNSLNYGPGTELYRPNALQLLASSGATGGVSVFSAAPTGYITFGTGGTAAANERMRIDQNGNVGIGTTSPAQALSVTGKVYTTGGIQFPDGSLQTAAAAAAATGLQGQVGFYNVNGSTISGTSTITISQAGLVGIGTAPGRSLDVQSTAADTVAGNDTVRISSTGTTGFGASVTLNSASITSGRSFAVTSTGSSDPGGAGKFTINDNSASAAARLTIDSSGNVGIGTTANINHSGNTAFLDVATNVLSQRGSAFDYFGNDASGPYLNLAKSRSSTVGTMSYPLAGDVLGMLTFSGASVSQNRFNIGATIESDANSTWSATNQESYLTFSTTPVNTFGNVERMRIDSAGNVGIGTTSPIFKLEVVDNSASLSTMRYINTGTGDARFVVVGNNAGQNAYLKSTSGGSEFGSSAGSSFVAFAPAAVEQMRITSAGNVGIGTTTPNVKLNVMGVIRANGLTQPRYRSDFFTNDSSGLTINSYDDNTTAYLPVEIDASKTVLGMQGNVGIGTTSPTYKLEVSGGDIAASGQTNPSIVMKSNAAGNPYGFLQYDHTDGDYMRIFDGTAYSMTWKTGNVGIGTASPGSKLEVNGDIRISSGSGGHLYFADGSSMITASAAGTGITSWNDVNLQTGGNLNFQTGNGSATSTKMVVTNAGNVGIGTVSPGGRLTVQGSSVSPTANILTILDSAGNYGGLAFRSDATNQWGIIQATGLNAGLQLRYNLAGTEYAGMTLVDTGNVGIGTTSPTSKLTVVGTTNGDGIEIQSSGSPTAVGLTIDNGVTAKTFLGMALTAGSGITGSATNDTYLRSQGGNILFSTDSGASAQMYLKNGGNVGIGTTSPTTKLHISGTGDNQLTLDTVSGGNNNAGLFLSNMGTPKWEMLNNAATGNNSLQFYSYAQPGYVMTMTGAGNVGIGTTTPLRPLDVVSGSVGTAIRVLGRASDSFGEMDFAANDGTLRGYIDTTATGMDIIRMGTNSLNLGTNNSVRMTIDGSGNIGIGTTSPSTNLDINGAAGNAYASLNVRSRGTPGAGYGARLILTNTAGDGAEFRLADSGSGTAYTAEANYLAVSVPTGYGIKLNSNGTDNSGIRITPAGNVGVGVASPAYKLEVNGSIKIDTGSLIFADGTSFSSAAGGAGSGITSWSDLNFQTGGVINFQTGNGSATSTKMAVTNAGRVGIGTASPGTWLEINNNTTSGSYGAYPAVTVNNPNAAGFAAFHLNGNGIQAGYLQKNSDNSLLLTTSAAAATSLQFGTAGVERVRIDASGNVGIGTTSPNYPLDVKNQTGASVMRLTGAANNNTQLYFAGATSGNLFILGTDISTNNGTKNFQIYDSINNTPRVTVDSSGNVGIGTTSPWGPLSVNPNGVTGPAFVVGSSTATNFIVTNGGNVGVGTASPSVDLMVSKASAADGVVTTSIQNTTATGFSRLTLGSNVSPARFTMAYYGTTHATRPSQAWLRTEGAEPIIFGIGDTEKVRIDSTGNVGIGTTTTALGRLSVDNASSGTVSNALVLSNYGAAANGTGSRIRFAALRAAGDAQDFSYINSTVADNTTSHEYGRLTLGTMVNGTLTDLLTAYNGNVGIGTTSPAVPLDIYSSVASYQVARVRGSGAGLSMGYDGSGNGLLGNTAYGTAITIGPSGAINVSTLGLGYVCSNGAGLLSFGTTCATSDARLKTNIVNISSRMDVLAALEKLNGVYYNWDLTNPFNNGMSSTTQVGMIAQNVEQVFPELVYYGTDGYARLDYQKLVGFLVEVDKAEQGEITSLDQRTSWMQVASSTATSTAPVMTFDPSTGNIGIGTTTPNHTLTVAGDVGAIAFVNTSTRDAKTDISYVSASSTDDMLNQLVNLKVATYRYKIESQQDPLRLGFIAEDAQTIAPEILSPDGKGVDLYKLATFNLSATQALAAKLDAQNTRLTSLEARVAALESGAVSSAGGSGISLSTTSIANALQSMSGVLHLRQLISDTFYAAQSFIDHLTVANITVGSTSTPSGVTLFDSVTKQPYCFSIANGAATTTPGACITSSETTNPFATSTAATATSTQTQIMDNGISITGNTNATQLKITLNGATPTYVSVGAAYTEAGAVVTGGSGGAVPYEVAVNGSLFASTTPALDTSAPTTYILTYRAVDGAGDTAIAYRSVIVGNPDGTVSTGTTTAGTITAPATTTPTSSGVGAGTTATTTAPIVITDIASTTATTTATSTTP